MSLPAFGCNDTAHFEIPSLKVIVHKLVIAFDFSVVIALKSCSNHN